MAEFRDYQGNIKKPTVDASDVKTSDNSNVQAKIDDLYIRTSGGSGGGGGDVINLFNPFSQKPLYHHLNQEIAADLIPAQSLIDLQYAHDLGFAMIEINPQLCSDGVYVCKHGSGGKLGAGVKASDSSDPSNILFSSVTSTWLRDNITYKSTWDKGKTVIPTLDEFCFLAKQLGMSVKAGNNGNDNVLAVMRKYLPDDMIFLSGRNTRGNFKGLIEYVWNPQSMSVDTCITRCLLIGNPICIVIEAGKFNGCSDELLDEFSQKAHQNGMLTSMVYPSGSAVIRALSHGLDAICSTNWDVNEIENGNAVNISALNDSNLVLANGASYDSATEQIAMPIGATIKVNANYAHIIRAVSAKIRYNGSLTFGSLTNYTSDGMSVVAQNFVNEPRTVTRSTNMLTITATEATTIYDISVKASIVK